MGHAWLSNMEIAQATDKHRTRVTAGRGASLHILRKPIALTPLPLRWREARRQAYQVGAAFFALATTLLSPGA